MKKKFNRKDLYALFAFFIGMYISFNIISNLIGWLLGIAFLIAFLYGVIVLYKGEKFIF